MLALLLLLQTTPDAAASRQDIVVTANPLGETERALRDCRARDCPLDQEIGAALAHGENLFVAGDYGTARSVLAATNRRTYGQAKRYPVEIGDLRRAEARIASHQGEDQLVRRGMTSAATALAKGLGGDDARVLYQRLLIADAMMLEDPRPRQVMGQTTFEDKWRSAIRTYDDVAAAARAQNLPDLEGRALIRSAALLSSKAAQEPHLYRARAEQALRRIAETDAPGLAAYRDAALLLEARMATRGHDAAAVDRLAARHAGPPTNRPVLLYAPPIDWSRSRDRTARVMLQAAALEQGRQALPVYDDAWIDVTFRIRGDGWVEDVEALTRSKEEPGDWVAPVLEAVRGRRYAPLALAAGDPGMLRVERHSYTAGWRTPSGSTIRIQSGRPRVVVTDLTVEPAPAPGAKPVPTG